jgi:hypothetical protein
VADLARSARLLAARKTTLGISRVVALQGDPVNSFSGNFVDQHVDLPAPVGGAGLGLTRTYNSMDDATYALPGIDQPGLLGPGVTTNLDEMLLPADYSSDEDLLGWQKPGAVSGLEWRAPDGRREFLVPTATGTSAWVVPANVHATVAWNSANRTFTMTDLSGVVKTFDETGLLVTTTAGSQTFTICRDGDRVPSRVVSGTNCGSTAPVALEVVYDSAVSDGLVDKVRLVDGSGTVLSQVTYSYTGGRLVEASLAHLPAESAAGDVGGFVYEYTGGFVSRVTPAS